MLCARVAVRMRCRIRSEQCEELRGKLSGSGAGGRSRMQRGAFVAMTLLYSLRNVLRTVCLAQRGATEAQARTLIDTRYKEECFVSGSMCLTLVVGVLDKRSTACSDCLFVFVL